MQHKRESNQTMDDKELIKNDKNLIFTVIKYQNLQS